MAWIKLQTTFLKSPAILRMRRHMGITKEKTVYLALSWLCYLDENTSNGQTRLLPEEIDDLFCQRKFATALVEATWASIEQDGTISARDYDLHNGDNTKKRLQQSIYDSRRASGKTRKKSGTQQSVTPDTNLENPRTESGKSQTGIWTREEKRREDINNSISNPPTITRSTPQHTTTLNRRQQDCNANRRYDL